MSLRSRFFVALALLIAAAGCDRKTEPAPPPASVAPVVRAPAASASAAPAASATIAQLSPALSRPAPEHLVAIGDLHGDVLAARRAFRLAGAIDDRDRWIGGKLVVVQTGDQIDRDDGDRAVLELFTKLKAAARAAGGELIALDGNHEIMNVALDFRYVTPGAFTTFGDVAPRDATAAATVGALPGEQRGRAAAFLPGSLYAKVFAEQPILIKVGDTVFVHGGILPKHVTYGLDRMNDELHAWMRGERPRMPAVVEADDAPVWTRLYAGVGGRDGCQELGEALAALGAKRMVIGHTVQEHGITKGCDDRLFRIDVGMSKFFGGPLEVLAIDGATVTIRK